MRQVDHPYNPLNLPKKVVLYDEESEIESEILYLYDANGVKMEKITKQEHQVIKKVNYQGVFQYTDEEMDFIHTAEGYTKVTHNEENIPYYNYVFNYTDHLGNVRVSWTQNPDAPGELVIIGDNHYYPFGLAHKGYQSHPQVHYWATSFQQVALTTVSSLYPESFKYKYNGKEIQEELGLNTYDYGARMYMPDIGRWGAIDMKAQAYYPISPYQYVLNNPVVNTDFQGQWTVSRHYSMTYGALAAAGIGKEQAKLIAHYSSVYADNPGEHLKWNNRAHPTNKHYYRDDIDYSGTANSQVTNYTGKGYNYNIWHSMRSGWEKENDKISASGAKKRGLQFGWSKIFESAESGKLNNLEKNSGGIQAFGQGIHALQDAYAHKGTTMDEHSSLNDRFNYGQDYTDAKNISETAVNVQNLLTENWDALDSSGIKLTNTEGMSQEQFSQVLSQIKKYLAQKDDEKVK